MAQLNTLLADGYDREVFERALGASQALAQVCEGFARLLPHAQALTCDLFCALYKMNVVLRPERELEPAALINRGLVEALLESGALAGLRQRTALDETTAAAAAAMLGRRMLEGLRRAFRSEPQALVDAADAARTQSLLQERRAELDHLEQHAPFGEKDAQALAEELRAELATLQARARRDRRRQRAAAERVAEVEGAIDVAIADTTGQLDGSADGLQGLGLSAGGSVDVDRRLQLGERVMRSQQLRRLARVVGAMREVAFEARRRRAARAPQAVHAITMGNDIERLLPAELLGVRAGRRHALAHGAVVSYAPRRGDALRLDFLRRYTERQLLQFRLQGPAERGPMVVCLDGSGSMQGAKELWAKAVALTLMEIARRERRRCLAIIFSSGQALFEVELLERRHGAGRAAVRDEEVLRFAEHFPGGGTDFEAPLERALAAVTEGSYRRGDIVFITDGQAQVSAALVARIAALRKRHRFRIRAILVDVGEHARGGVQPFADDVHEVSNLASDAIAGLFAAV